MPDQGAACPDCDAHSFSTASSSPGATPVAAIPLSEIAIRGTELKLELRGYADLLNQDSALEAIEQTLKSSGLTLDEELRDIERLIGSAGGYNEIFRSTADVGCSKG